MAKTEVKPNANRNHIIKIMYDDNEPPKDYIWARSDGFFYRWENGHWEGYDDVSQMKWDGSQSNCSKESCSCKPVTNCTCNNYVTPDQLTLKLDRLKKDLLALVSKLIQKGTDTDVTKLTRDIESLDTRVDTLESSGFITSNDGYATQQWVEGHNYLTNQSLDNYYTKDEIDNLTIDENEFAQLAEDLNVLTADNISRNTYINGLLQRIQSLENSVSNLRTSLNELSSTVAGITIPDHSQFITAVDVNTASVTS